MQSKKEFADKLESLIVEFMTTGEDPMPSWLPTGWVLVHTGIMATDDESQSNLAYNYPIQQATPMTAGMLMLAQDHILATTRNQFG